MSDPVSPQAAGQAANPFQQATPVSGQQPVPQPAGEQGQEPQYFTRQEAEAMRTNILREAQSLVDKTGGRIEKKVMEIREQMSANGVQLSAEQEATLRSNLAKTTPAPSPEPVTMQPAQAMQSQTQVDPAIVIASKVMQDSGVTIFETDPEFAKIKPHIGADGSVTEPLKMLQALNDAIAQKSAREAAKSNPASRLPLGGQQPAGKPAMSPREKMAAGLSK